MFVLPLPDRRRASPVLRDRFLNALEAQDEPALQALAHELLGCSNPLPSGTCDSLGLAPGSTYGDGADAVTRAQRLKPAAA
jgi:hypothetical protein